MSIMQRLGPYDVILRVEGANIVARNYKGAPLYSGTARHTIINQALALGGKVILASSVELAGSISILAAVEFQALPGAIISMASATNLPLIQVGDGGTTPVTGVKIKNITIDGANQTNIASIGILFYHEVTKSTVESCKVSNTYGDAIALEYDSDDNSIIKNEVYTCRGTGIRLYESDGNLVSENIVDGITNERGIAVYPNGDTYVVSKKNRILGNKIKNVSSATVGYGIYLYGSEEAEVIGNEVDTCNVGIKLISQYCHKNTLMGNTCNNNALYGIHVAYYSTSGGGPVHNQIIGNTCCFNQYDGIFIEGSSYNQIRANTCNNNVLNQAVGVRAGIYVSVSGAVLPVGNYIIGNTCSDDQETKTQKYGITVANANAVDNVIKENILVGNKTAPMLDGSYTYALRAYEVRQDSFVDILAADTDYIRADEDLSAATPITFTITNQPDAPRSLTWVVTHAQITAFSLEIIGVNARGEVVTETFTEASGWSGATSNALATITTIKLLTRTGTGSGDLADIGIGSKLGLANRIAATADVFKVRKNGANYPLTSCTTNATYHTVDVSTGGAITDADDFVIQSRVNQNRIA